MHPIMDISLSYYQKQNFRMFKLLFISLAIITLSSAAVLGYYEDPEVKIPQGALKGKYQTSRKGRIFNAFTGIPYAKPPVGDLRFKAPVAAEAWEGTLDASKSHAVCPQIDSGDGLVIGNEDCLFLNVYTPQLPASNNHFLPVILFIHGGFFKSGSGTPEKHGARILLDKDIVLVTINYRLGALGFLSTGDEVVLGNNGLKDQNLALKWIKNNIAAFGGDPERITIVGQSAGAVSAHHHMFSPLSRDLIKGVIAQSGSAMEPWALARNNEHIKNAKKLAEFLDCPTASSEVILECLKKVDAVDIVKQEVKYVEWALDQTRPFKPVIEPAIEGAFLSEHPEDILKSGKAANIPFMAGITSEEGGTKASKYYRHPSWIEDLDKEFNRVVPICLEYDNQPNKDEISAQLRDFYFGDKRIDNTTKGELTKMFTDLIYFIGAEKAVRMGAQHNSQPVYYYLFGYHGSETFCPPDLDFNYGVCHADDLIYLFNLDKSFPNYKPTKSDEEMTDVLSTLWANFAETGNPTPQVDSIIPTKWEPVQSEDMEYYFIKSASGLQTEKGLYSERAKFLRELDIYSNKNEC